MAIYLGDSGQVELQRGAGGESYSTALGIDDVNVSQSRLSFSGLDVDSLLITGDRVHFERTDGGALQLLSGSTDTGIAKYVHVDEIGGLRLYDTFPDAVNGLKSKALKLVTPTEQQDLAISVEDLSWQCLAQVQSYSITTSRETVDLTNLGDDFRSNFAQGLISGQGSLDCLWDYRGSDSEYAQYLTQLVIRAKLGAEFRGRFFLKRPEAVPVSQGCEFGAPNTFVRWEADCIVTNVSMALSATDAIRSTIEFVTTGPFRLSVGVEPVFLSQDVADPLASDFVLEEETGKSLEIDWDN